MYAKRILFVRAIPFTTDKYFNDIGNGINFAFALNRVSDTKDTFYIDLINSYVNGMPFYKFLGFQGDYASGLELPDDEIEKVFSKINLDKK